jgi:urease accessory protein
VERVGERQLLHTSPGLLRAQRLHGTPGRCRVALLATTALLLGGDAVELQVDCGPGTRLELSEVAGTVAYAGRGRRALWHTRIRLDAGAALVFAGEPFVVADGADVERTLELGLADDASVVLRETLVLGRDGERGGRIRGRARVRRGGQDLLVEEQDWDPVSRRAPGILGPHRVIDSLLAVGAGEDQPIEGATRLELAGGGTLTRWLGASLADSPLVRSRRASFPTPAGRPPSAGRTLVR